LALQLDAVAAGAGYYDAIDSAGGLDQLDFRGFAGLVFRVRSGLGAGLLELAGSEEGLEAGFDFRGDER